MAGGAPDQFSPKECECWDGNRFWASILRTGWLFPVAAPPAGNELRSPQQQGLPTTLPSVPAAEKPSSALSLLPSLASGRHTVSRMSTWPLPLRARRLPSAEAPWAGTHHACAAGGTRHTNTSTPRPKPSHGKLCLGHGAMQKYLFPCQKQCRPRVREEGSVPASAPARFSVPCEPLVAQRPSQVSDLRPGVPSTQWPEQHRTGAPDMTPMDTCLRRKKN